MLNPPMKLSHEALTGIAQWESLVLYVYDDMVPVQLQEDGKHRYPEWDGGDTVGTLTIGYGHTDEAGEPKIEQGMRITAEQALAIFQRDLSKVEAEVNKRINKTLTQGQYDSTVDMAFNCWSGFLDIAKAINAGMVARVPSMLPHYVTSQGKRLNGLVRRRAFDLTLWNGEHLTSDADEGGDEDEDQAEAA